MQNSDNIKRLIKTLRCSSCGKNFDDKSIIFNGQHGELTVIKICCKHCEKSFAIAFMGLYQDEFDRMIEGGKTTSSNEEGKECEPINYDDVLNAHHYIENIDDNWKNFINNKKDTNTV